MRIHAGLALAACLAPALAIFEDDAYHIDFHHALLGLPKRDATFFQKPYAGSKASLLYTISQNQTIGAVRPKDGALVWRQVPPLGAQGLGTVRAGEDQDTVVSAVGDRITAWSASDGRVVWEHRADGAIVEDLEILEQEDGMTNVEAKDVIVLLKDAQHGTKRLDGKTGRAKWTHRDSSGDTPFQLSTSPTTIYSISLHAPLLGGWMKLRVTSLSPITGKQIDQYTLNSEIQAKEDILFAGANTAAPLLAWTDRAKKVLKVNIIGTKGISTFTTPSKEPIERIVLHASGRVNSRTHFLVEYHTASGHSAEVYHVNLQKGTVEKAYDLPALSGTGTFTVSASDANVYFTRATAEEITVVSSVSHGIIGRWPIKETLALAGAHPVHGTSEVVVKDGKATNVRSAILFSNGQWALIQKGEVAWTRPEFLSGTVSAAWADLPEEETLAHELEVEGHQNVLAAYIHRVNRHIKDLVGAPAWLQSLPQRLIGNLLGTAQVSTLESIQDIQHDTFGFHKLVVVVTEGLRLAALDVGSQGKVLWNMDLGLLAPSTRLQHPSIKSLRGCVQINDPALTKPLFINTTTGALLSSQDHPTQSPHAPQAHEVILFGLVESSLNGYLNHESGQSPIWTFSPPAGERIVSYTARPLNDPVASIGVVLGDRRVLYKYLNPNLVLVTTISEPTQTASFYLLDSASGQLLHATSQTGIDTSRPIASALSENWFAYSLTLAGTLASESRGHLLVVSDLFESALPDDRGPLGASSNSSTVQPSRATGDSAKPYIISQTYHIQEEISHMTVTRTKQGITSRELLVTLPSSNSLVGIPRTILDPRRPVGRDPSAQEQAEGLVKYAPLIIFDPKWHLNHKYEVAGIQGVITSESGLESTSLVFAYGTDVFGTRVAPSFAFDVLGKGFNKLQMLLTVAALFVGVLFVAPLVRRKQINSLWTMP